MTPDGSAPTVAIGGELAGLSWAVGRGIAAPGRVTLEWRVSSFDVARPRRWWTIFRGPTRESRDEIVEGSVAAWPTGGG